MSTYYFKYWIVFKILLFSTFSLAQNWINQGGGIGKDESFDVEVDGQGNTYTTGYISSNGVFGDNAINVTSYGQNDVYVSKSDPNGNYLWVRTFGGPFSERGYDIDVDLAGNSVITGYFKGTVVFDSYTLTSSAGSQDVFVVKLDPSGNVVWAIAEGGVGYEIGLSVAFDGMENVLVSGHFKGETNFGGTSHTSIIEPNSGLHSFDMFVVKYDSGGNFLWSKIGQSIGNNKGTAVDVDMDDNVLLTGQFGDTLVFAGTIQNNTILNAGFVCKLDASGTLDWFTKLSGGHVVPNDIEVNSVGEVFSVGDFSGQLIIHGSPNSTLSNQYQHKTYAIKQDSTGELIWGSVFGSDNNVSTKAIALDPTGDIFVSGTFKCNLTEFTDSLGSGLFNSVGFNDVFVAKFLANGDRDWVRQYGGQWEDFCSGVAIYDVDFPILSGSFDRFFNFPRDHANPTQFLGTSEPCLNPNGWSFAQNCPYPSPSEYRFLEGNESVDIFVGKLCNSAYHHYYYYLNVVGSGVACGDSMSPCFRTFGSSNCFEDTLAVCTPDLYYFPNTVGGGISEDVQFYPPLHPYVYPLNGYSPYSHHPGPYWDYYYSTNDTVDFVNLTTSQMVYASLERKDGCDAYHDSIYVEVFPEPEFPLLTDSHGVNVLDSTYNPILACFPDTVVLEFTNLDSTSILQLSSHSTSTIILDSTCWVYDSSADIYVTVTNNLGCTSVEEIPVGFIQNSEDTIVPYLMLNDPVDYNDSIEICLGELFQVLTYDSLDNVLGDINNYFYSDVVYSQEWFINGMPGDIQECGSETCISGAFGPTTTGWYDVEVYFELGYSNICGTNLTNYYVSDSFYVEVHDLPEIDSVLVEGGGLFCPGDTAMLWLDSVVQGGIWYGPEQNLSTADTLFVSSEGTYAFSYSMIDSITGCSTFYLNSAVVQHKNQPQLQVAPSELICPGDSVLLSAPTALSYVWIGPSGDTLGTNQSVYGSSPGQYSCIVTDADLCAMVSNEVVLQEYATPYLVASPDTEICLTDSANISVVHGGNASFNWINPVGETTSELTVTSPGTYSCEITQCGFTITDSVIITLSIVTPEIIPLTDTVLCYGDTAELIVLPSGMQSYEWSDNAGFSDYLSVTTSGSYDVTVTDYNGCYGTSAPIQILIHPSSLPPEVTHDTVCSGQDAILMATSTFDLNWYNESGTLVFNSDSLTLTALMQDTVFYVSQMDSLCESELVPIHGVVSSASLNNQILFNDTLFCEGEDGVFESTEVAENIEWTLPDGTITSGGASQLDLLELDTTMSGWLTLQLSDQYCTGEIDSVYLQVSPFPEIALSPIDTACSEDSVQLFVSSSLNSMIYVNQNFVSVDSAEIQLIAGTYIISVENPSGCSVDSVIQVSEYGLQVPLSVANEVACGDSVIVIDFTDSLFYEWNGQINYSNGDSILLSSDSVSIPYWQIDNNGCLTDTAIFSIIVANDSAPLLYYSDSIICEGDSIVLSSSEVADNYFWTTSLGNSMTGQEVTFIPNQGETIWHYTSTEGCVTDTTIFSIYIIDSLSSPMVEISDSTYCFGDSIVLEFVNFNDSLSYWMSPGQTSVWDSILVLTVSIDNQGTYTAITDNQGCVQQVDVEVAVEGFPVSPLSAFGDTLELCETDSLFLDFYLGSNFQHEYMVEGISYSDSAIILIPPFSQASTPFVISLTDTNGCILLDSLHVVVSDLPNYSLMDTVICEGDTLTIDLVGPYDFYWSNGIVGNSNKFVDSGHYDLEIVNGSCYSITGFNLDVVNCVPHLPNVFSPNEDGINDVYSFASGELDSSHLIIYNRWGRIVYETHASNAEWDGRNMLGEDLNEGVYYYLLRGETTDQQPFETSGFIQLIR